MTAFLGLAEVGAAGALADTVVASRAEIHLATATEAQFILDLSSPVEVEITALEQPYRVVIDLPGVAFRLDPAAGRQPNGFVAGVRFEAVAADRGRVVIDTAGPVTVTRASVVPQRSDTSSHGVVLTIGLRSNGVETGADRPSARAAAAGPVTTGSVKAAVYEDVPARREARSKSVILIDPGHGGVDPGAIGRQHTAEKTVVLAVARELQAALIATGRYDARLTRSDDVYLALDKRVDLSRQLKADLFLSLHADAIDDNTLAGSIHGASIYTLSERASDEQARLMADKENTADLAAGIDSATVDGGEGIKDILFDLMSRETAAFSRLLAHAVAEALGRTGGLAREPERAAAFRVLKQPHAPSVLIELGFLSNPEEEGRMVQSHWQKQIAQALASAVDRYFAARASAEAAQWTQGQAGRLPP